MGTAGTRLIHGLDPADIADDLARLCYYEQPPIHVVRAHVGAQSHATPVSAHADRVAETAWESEGGATASES